MLKLHFFQETFSLKLLYLLVFLHIFEYLNLTLQIILDPPTPNFTDYPIRVEGTTIYDPKHNPRIQILTERFITNKDLLSNKRKKTELERLQTPNLELKFEVKVKLQGVNPHPVFQNEHETTSAAFDLGDFDLERDPNLPT